MKKLANVSISSSLFPYRLSLKQHAKLAAELTVEVRNNDSKSKLLSFEMRLPEQVSLDKGGLNRLVSKQIKELAPSTAARMSFPVFLTQRADLGVFSGKLLVSEHALNFEYPTAHYSKEIAFRIIG